MVLNYGIVVLIFCSKESFSILLKEKQDTEAIDGAYRKIIHVYKFKQEY